MSIFLAGLAVTALNVIPPIEIPSNPVYYNNTAAIIVTVGSQEEMNHYCGTAAKGWVIQACANPAKNVVFMPNPCLFIGQDVYADLLCHELAHTQGWEHEKK